MAIRAVILDWAGTTVDCGCHAPVGVFVELFRRRGVAITHAEARGPMGTHKREHIRRLCADPDIARRWWQASGQEPTKADVDAMYAEGEPLQVAVIPDYADPVPGCVETIAALRARGLRIGSTTGYNRAMLDALLPAAAARGYAPDVAVPASDAPQGRPAPFLNWLAMMRLGVWPASDVVVVGDTEVDMAAARSAGAWAVGVTLTGNGVGLGAEDLAALSPEERAAAHARVGATLRASGAHHVLEDLTGLPGLLDALDAAGSPPPR